MPPWKSGPLPDPVNQTPADNPGAGFEIGIDPDTVPIVGTVCLALLQHVEISIQDTEQDIRIGDRDEIECLAVRGSQAVDFTAAQKEQAGAPAAGNLAVIEDSVIRDNEKTTNNFLKLTGCCKLRAG